MPDASRLLWLAATARSLRGYALICQEVRRHFGLESTMTAGGQR
jgi:hypothetical protein